jgi:hypothetical protein
MVRVWVRVGIKVPRSAVSSQFLLWVRLKLGLGLVQALREVQAVQAVQPVQ